MQSQRRWVAAGVLLVLGALAGVVAVWQHWRTCTGPQTVLDAAGTVVESARGEACLQAMDNGFAFLWPDGKDPLRAESVAGLVFALLLGLSWVVALPAVRWSRRGRWLAALPVVLVLAVLVLSVLPRSDALDSAFAHVLMALSLSVLLALLLVVLRDSSSPSDMLKVGLALCGPAAVGLFASLADYTVMVTFSAANWDTPPWKGTPTLVATTLAGVALVVVALREGRRAGAAVAA